MIVVPSIDVSGGRAVKRIKGVRGSGMVLGNPMEVAYELYSLGYDHIHIVDLDAAEDMGSNEHIIKGIASIGFKWIQVGGGIRNVERASRMLSYGASAIIVSTVFFTDPDRFSEIHRCVGWDKILVSIDYGSDRNVMIKGWNTMAIDLDSAVKLLKEVRLLGAIFTYISTEGTCMGVDRGIGRYVRAVNGLKEYAGGVATYDDLLFLKNVGFDYVIMGMALYAGHLKGVRIV